MSEDLYVSWSEYHHKIELLAAKVYQSQWQFDQIICVAKGGLRVGDIFARIFDQPLAIMFTSSYGGLNNRTRGKIKFSQHLTTVENQINSQVLLVDDLVDSGYSLQASIEWLQQHYGDSIREIRTAVIWYKSCSTIEPDYYVDYLQNDPWIHQPFERYEKMKPVDLLARSDWS